MQTNIDTKLCLLAGKSIEVIGFGEIKPLTLGQVIEFGYENYLQLLNIFCFKKDQFMKDAPKEFSMFDFLLLAQDEIVQRLFINALEFFLQDKATVFKENHLIAIGTTKGNIRVVSRENYEEIAYIIQMQNYMRSVDDDTDIFAKSDKAQEVKDKLAQRREEVRRLKNKETGEVQSDFFDLLSSISAKGNISKKELLSLTMFQIYDEYKRLIHIDQYDTGIYALTQGAKNVKLEHWSSKIKF